MTREEIEKMLPPIPLSEVVKGMERAKEFAKTYVSRVNPIYSEGYENETSEANYKRLVEISDRKEARLAKEAKKNE